MNDTTKSKKPEFSLASVLANEVTKKQLLGFIEEVVLCEGKIKTEREALKDIKNEAETSLGIPSSLLGDLVRERMDVGSIEAKIKKLEEAQGIAEGLGISDSIKE
jgi:hypothetical protein